MQSEQHKYSNRHYLKYDTIKSTKSSSIATFTR